MLYCLLSRCSLQEKPFIMTKIIPLRHSDLKKVRKMIEYVSPEVSPHRISNETYVHFPFNTIHGLLPIRLKFIQECYVAVEGDNLLGLISLVPDGSQKTRWKINRLILNPNAFDAGKQLVDYVVNKFGGAGVETFITSIDENYAEAISLFKNACFFRSSSKMSIWESYDFSMYGDKQDLLRPAKPSDAQKLLELDREALFPNFRASLLKTAEDFKFGYVTNIINELKGQTIKSYVLENPDKNSIEAFLSVMTSDNKSFWVDITMSPAYKEYYEDVLNFAAGKVYSMNSSAKFYIGIRNFQQTAEKAGNVLKNRGFNQLVSFELLVKDYWKPAEYAVEKKVPIMIFPDLTSPACNITRFIKEF